MKVIRQVNFTQSMLISTTATDPHSTWLVGTSYVLGAQVKYLTRIYESLTAGNIGHTPDVSTTYWLDIGPANQYAMFDRQVSTGTTAGTTLTVTIAPGAIVDSIALINLDTDTVKITVRDGLGGPIIYGPFTGGLSGTTVGDWYQYFFYDPLLKRTQLIFSGIPPYINAHITLEFVTATTISVGECVFGVISDIGDTQYGANSGIIDFSIKETDEFGNFKFIERPYSKRLTAQVMVRNSQLNRVQQLLYSLRAVPAVWIGSDDPTFEEATVIYGWYKDFSMDISYPSHSICSLEIEGLT